MAGNNSQYPPLGEILVGIGVPFADYGSIVGLIALSFSLAMVAIGVLANL